MSITLACAAKTWYSRRLLRGAKGRTLTAYILRFLATTLGSLFDIKLCGIWTKELLLCQFQLYETMQYNGWQCSTSPHKRPYAPLRVLSMASQLYEAWSHPQSDRVKRSDSSKEYHDDIDPTGQTTKTNYGQ
ncbi:hypothetical protein EDB87DRAFT_1574717 [Lactarius vividus]|nr:hypothetical protein EDB87DRAFT_1574717 [Lactarius vividus]